MKENNSFIDYFGLQIVAGMVLGALQFTELTLNLQLHFQPMDTLKVWIVGMVLGILTQVLFGGLLFPMFWASLRVNVARAFSLSLLLSTSMHLALLLFPFAHSVAMSGRTSLAAILVGVWASLVFLVRMNLKFWIVRLVQQQTLRPLYRSLAILSLLITAGGALFSIPTQYGSSNAISSDPDVIILSLDGVGIEALSRYSNSSGNHTPNLDSLANQCLDYSEAVTVATDVFPAHVAMFTGRYPGQLNIVNNDSLLKFGSETLAERFAREGYATALFASNPILDMSQGFAQGVQLIDVDQPLQLASFLIRGALRFRVLEQLKAYLSQPIDTSIPLKHAQSFLSDYKERPVFAWIQTELPNHLEHSQYVEEVKRLDEQVGAFVRMMDARAVERERLLIVTSAFGMHFEFGKGEHQGVFEGSIRVPLVICPLKVNAQKSSESILGQVRTIDIPNTIYAQVGFAHNKELQSVDISDRNKAAVVYQTLLVGRDPAFETGYQLAYRFQASGSEKMYKYIWLTEQGQHGIYQLNNDPKELENILPKATQMASELSKALTHAGKGILALELRPERSIPENLQLIP